MHLCVTFEHACTNKLYNVLTHSNEGLAGDLRRLGVLSYLPTLHFICTCCEEVDQLDSSEASGDDLVYGTLGAHLQVKHNCSVMALKVQRLWPMCRYQHAV